VLVHRGGAGYEVEFSTLAGRTLAVVTVRAGDVRPVGEREIAHARQVAYRSYAAAMILPSSGEAMAAPDVD